MEANVILSFTQLLELIKALPGEQKIRLTCELEKDTSDSKLTELLLAFKTDQLSFEDITREVEEV